MGKLSPKVPTKNSMRSAAFRSGCFQTYTKPSTRLPRVRAVRWLCRSSPRRTRRSEPSTATNESALRRNTHPVPTAAMSTPAMAGPMRRAALNDVELRPTALDRSSSGTISDTNACRTGASNAVTHPRRKASTYTCHSWTTPLIVRSPKTRAQRPSAVCVAKRSLRRSRWSAAKPVTGSRSSCGPNCRAMTTPTAVALLRVSCVRTSQSCAVRCIHVPTLDTSPPAAYVR